jgi:hypothetical protein
MLQTRWLNTSGAGIPLRQVETAGVDIEVALRPGSCRRINIRAISGFCYVSEHDSAYRPRESGPDLAERLREPLSAELSELGLEVDLSLERKP